MDTKFALFAVVTSAEALKMWPDVPRHRLMMDIYRGNLEARQPAIGQPWIITRASLIRMYDQPSIDLEDTGGIL